MMAVVEAKAITSLQCGDSATAATAAMAKVAKTTATAAKANDDDDNRGGDKSDGDGDGNGGDGGGRGDGGGSGSGGGDDDGDDDGDNDCLARDDRINGGCRGPPPVHGAEPPRPCRCPVVKRRLQMRCSKAGDFELHRRADVRAFVLGRGLLSFERFNALVW